MKNKSPMAGLMFFAKACKGKLTLSIICATISVAGGILPYVCAYNIMKVFFDGTQTTEQIWLWFGLALTGFFVKALFHAVSTTLSHVSAYTILENIRLFIADKLMRAPLGTVQSQNIGKLKNLIVDHVETIELPLAHVIPEGFAAFVLPMGVFAYLCAIDWRLALASLITIPLAAVPYAIAMGSYSKTYDAYMKSSDHMNGVIVEYVEGIEVVKAFNQSTTSYEKFQKAVASFKKTTLDWFRSTWAMRTLGGAILPSTLLGVLPLGMVLYMREGLNPATVTICMLLSMGIVGSLTKFTVFVNQLKAIQYAMKSISESMDIPELKSEAIPVPLKNYSIRLEHASFSYSGQEDDEVLHGIHLHLKEGSFSALVGPSGGGKSTVARLISRFWDVTDGTITIGGVDIRKIPLSQLADTVSFVTQDNFLFNCSLLENIRLGNPKAIDGEVYAAASAAQCDEFIARLEKGYHTTAGEAGGKLSGGERQRIAIARAMLKNAPIVVLDEATSFTDPENEEKLQRSIAALTKGKTLLVIAHRLSTIKNADKIIVLNKGKLEAEGTHFELLQSCTLYKDMWEAHIGTKNWAVSAGRGVLA